MAGPWLVGSVVFEKVPGKPVLFVLLFFYERGLVTHPDHSQGAGDGD
jgi:hypothetical protein